MGGVVVLGAGLAGLGFARQLPNCRMFEAEASPGGHARSHEAEGISWDEGAHISHSRVESFRDLIDRAAGQIHSIGPSIVRNLWQNQWLGYPVQNHLHTLPVDLRVRALSDLVEARLQIREPATDYRSWCLHQYGKTLTETFYDEFTAKYWRVSGENLATDWLGGRLIPPMLPRIIKGAFMPVPEEQAVFSRFHYPARGGFFQFFAGLYDHTNLICGERAVAIDAARKNARFASGRVESYDALASSIPLPDLVRMIDNAPLEIRRCADELRCTQLLCVNMIVKRPRLSDCHWFYIYDRAIEAARVSLPSNLAPGSLADDRTALQAEIFRRDDEEVDIDSLVEKTIAQMGALFGFERCDVAYVGHRLVKRAYVISDHRRSQAVATIVDWLENRDIYPMGLYGRWKYVWSDEAYQQGCDAALRVASQLGLKTA